MQHLRNSALSVVRALSAALALTVSASSVLWAQSGDATPDGPSFDCARAASEAEKLICAEPDLAGLDRALAARFTAALQAAQMLETGSADAEANLRTEQRGWIKGRDACWTAEDIAACVGDTMRLRDAQLAALWMLEPVVNTAVWRCGPQGREEVVTIFFDTELPAVRFETGDTIDAGTLVRTASGARYDGSFGRSIWMKGAEASYTRPDAQEAPLDCTLVEGG